MPDHRVKKTCSGHPNWSVVDLGTMLARIVHHSYFHYGPRPQSVPDAFSILVVAFRRIVGFSRQLALNPATKDLSRTPIVPLIGYHIDYLHAVTG